MHPFHAAPLIRPQEPRQLRRLRRRGQHLPTPRFHFRRKREAQLRVVEQREYQVGRERAALSRVGAVRVGDVLLPRVERLPAVRRHRHDAHVGQNHRLAFALQQRAHLGLGQKPLSGTEDPTQIERRVSVGRGRTIGSRRPLRHRFHFDRARALEQVCGLLIELQRKHPPPRRERRLQEIWNLRERLQQVSPVLLTIVKVRFPRIGR